jgi:hypothetical protein
MEQDESYEIDEDVLKAISDERAYQERKWGSIVNHSHEVGGYLTLMRCWLTDAERAWSNGADDHDALDELRKVVAIGIACLEQHGAPARLRADFFALKYNGRKLTHRRRTDDARNAHNP